MYSVWQQGRGVFDYFEDRREQPSLNAPAPTHIGHRTLGSTVDQAAWPLPADAKRIGSGPVAIGRIAATKAGGALGDIGGSPLVKAGLLTVAAILAYKYVVKGGR
jgi:hypothetical protein